jgi:predicted DNA-binding transcriptional regulator YafY
MPLNKNAVARYQTLDRCLSDGKRYYTIQELTNKVNDDLENALYNRVCERTIQNDLSYIGDQDGAYRKRIIRFIDHGVHVVHYAEGETPIFTKQLTDDEKNLLCEMLNTLGQFEGLDDFEWFDATKKGLELDKDERRIIISFSQNEFLKNKNMLGKLFKAIANKSVIEINYMPYKYNTPAKYIASPYLLKQYNNRWFLICSIDESTTIMNFALDRIVDFEINHNPEIQYEECSIDLAERFEDIIGVTFKEGQLPVKILLWVSDKSFKYIDTKPIHSSQTVIKDQDKIKSLRGKYTEKQYPGGHFINIEVIENYELLQNLMFYMDGIALLEPIPLREEITSHILALYNLYYFK